MINVSGLGGKCLKITYLYHSGFSVELETCVLLFDYYRGTLPVWEKEKPVYVFVSHKHKDHFNMEIFGLAERYGQVHFFLGSDIKLSEKYLERNGIPASVKSRITNVGKNKTLEFSEDLTVRTLRSTGLLLSKPWTGITKRKWMPSGDFSLMPLSYLWIRDWKALMDGEWIIFLRRHRRRMYFPCTCGRNTAS